MTARSLVRVLVALIALCGRASDAQVSRPVAVSGAISADNGVFTPIGQDGCVVTFLHPDEHTLTGSLEGRMIEEGTLVLNTCTGDGLFSTTAEFVGTVMGSSLGTAKMTVLGRLRDSSVIDEGHFVLSQGTAGLAGVHVVGTFTFVLGQGGTYDGLAHVDARRR